MIVRLADENDRETIIRGTEDFGMQAGVRDLMADDMGREVDIVMAIPQVRIYLAEHGGEVCGGLGVSVFPFLWNRDLLEMSELFFWTWPGAPFIAALRLLRTVMRDCEAEGIHLATFVTLPTSPEKVETVYRKLGFVPHQSMFRKVF